MKDPNPPGEPNAGTPCTGSPADIPGCGAIMPKAGAANDVGLFSPPPRAAIDPAKPGGADGAETTTDVPGGVGGRGRG